MKSILTSSVAALALLSVSAFAGETIVAKSAPAPEPESFYNAHEFSGGLSALLGFRSGSLGENATWGNSTAWGVDVEATYFFTKNWGIGLEGSYIDLGRPVFGTALNAYLRAPLGEGSRVAIYLFGGVGGLYGGGDGRFEGHGGAGIEYRFTPKFGIFTDCRHVWVDGSGDNIPRFGEARAGFRFVF